MKRIVLRVLMLVLGVPLIGQSYPFALPTDIEASISITTSAQEEFNNLLLGTNIHNFTTTQEKAFIRIFDPITVRFPHGLWSNWYDWRRDVSRVFGEEQFQYKQGTSGVLKSVTIDHLANIKVFDNANIKVGIDGLTSLNREKKTKTGKGYPMMWTFNMSADGTDFTNACPETMARYDDLIYRGFEVKTVEMGNECFYPGQRSSIIPNAEDYIARAKAMSAALKAKDSTILVSIPLLRKSSWANPNWNRDLTRDTSYFDAVTIHTYVGADPDNAADSDEAYGTALTARKHLLASITEYPHKVVPNKPIWLTEWGVKSGGPNAVSALGAVDCYIMMSEHQDIFQRANWFSTNGKLNSMVVWEKYFTSTGQEKERIKYPLEKTLFGSAYEITRAFFEHSVLLESSVDVVSLQPGVKAVSARVVIKDEKISLLALNLTNKEVPFTINADGAVYEGKRIHRYLSFTAMDEERALPFEEDPLSDGVASNDSLILPPLSINIIALIDLKVSEGASIVTPSFTTGLSISPNPCNGYFSIELADMSNASYVLYSLGGKEVRRGSFVGKTDVHIDNYIPGLYLLQVDNGSAQAMKKVMLK